MTKQDILCQTLRLIRPLQQELEAATAVMLSDTTITVRTRAMLDALNDLGRATVPQLGKKLGIQRQYVQVMMNEAETSGLVQCRVNPAHRRSVLFELTTPGRDILSGLDRAERQIAVSLSRRFTEGDIEKTHQVIEHILKGFRDLNQSLKD